MPRAITLLTFFFLLPGCVTYEYDLVKPERFAGHISRKSEVVANLDPLAYHFITYENHLIIRIKNDTDDPIQLQGDHSTAIDPHGESHPLRSQTIAPGSFIKLILPPPRPTVYDPGPHFGFGVGVMGGAYHRDPFFAEDYWSEPRYYTVYDEANNLYWDWPGQSTARLILTFQRGDKTFKDEFSFFRKKM